LGVDEIPGLILHVSHFEDFGTADRIAEVAAHAALFVPKGKAFRAADVAP
jgi:hypothetical protein